MNLFLTRGLYYSQRFEKEFRSCQGYGHVSYQRLHEGKDRDTDFAGSRNPCSGFRGDDKAAGKRAVQPGHIDSCGARQGRKRCNK